MKKFLFDFKRLLPAVLAVVTLSIPVPVFAGSISNTPLSAADRTAAQTAVSTVKSATDSKWGTPGSLDRNAAQPLVSGTSMSTVDGTKSWSGATVCGNSATFLHLDALPTGSGGDLTASLIEYTDTVNPTVVTYNHTLPRISGICLNGFISCDAGTWANCQFYQWSSTLDGKMGETLVGADMLAGCNCINASCNYPLVANASMLMDRVASGMAAAIMNASLNLIIGKATINSTTVELVGQRSDNCTSSSSMGTGPSPTTNSIAQLNPADIAIKGALAYASSDLASGLNVLGTQSQGGISVHQCTKQWTFDVGPQTIDVADSGAGSLCVVSSAIATFQDKGGGIYNIEINASTDPSHPGCGANSLVAKSYDTTAIIGGLALPSTAASAAHFITYIGGVPTANMDIQVVFNPLLGVLCSATPMNITDINYALAFTNCSVVANNQGTYSYTSRLRFKYDNFIRTASNNCDVYVNDPGCALYERWEYDALGGGTQTFSRYNPTGLVPLASTITKTGMYGTYQETRNAWKIVSTYICAGTTTPDYTSMQNKAIDRAKTVESTLVNNGATMTYNDKTCSDSGLCTTVTGSIDFSAQRDGANTVSAQCIPMCKLKAPATVTAASSGGNQQQQSTSTLASNPIFRICVSGICPAEAGEVIVPYTDGSTCGCPDEYTHSIATIAALVAAGRDQICSTGVRR